MANKDIAIYVSLLFTYPRNLIYDSLPLENFLCVTNDFFVHRAASKPVIHQSLAKNIENACLSCVTG